MTIENTKQNLDNIEFKARQRFSKILPRQGDTQKADPFGPKSKARTTNAIDIITAALAGERPVLGGQSKGDKWVMGQIKELSEKGFAMQEPSAYYTTKPHEKVLGYSPTSNFLIEEKNAIEAELPNIKGLRFAGTSNAFLRPKQIDREIDNARIIITPAGDLNALRETLEIIRHKQEGQMIDQPLIIENPHQGSTGHFWDETLRNIKILDKNSGVNVDPLDRRTLVDYDSLAHHYGIYITEQREDTLDLIRYLDKNLPPIDSEYKPRTILPDGAILFTATGTMKKHEQMKDMLIAQGFDIEIRSIYELVDTYVSPKETSGTYEGNCAEKPLAAFESWHNMDEKTRVQRLKHLGITKNQAFLLAEDSGIAFLEPDLALEDEFGDIRHKLDVTAPMPGVETGPGVFGSNGISNFMQKIVQIFARRTNPDRRVNTKSVLAVAPLEQPDLQRTLMHMVGAEVTCTFTDNPAPNTGTVEIDNYIIPTETSGLPRGQTEAQLGKRHLNFYTARARAFKALMQDLGLKPQHDLEKKMNYSKEFVAGIVCSEFNKASYSRAKALEAQHSANQENGETFKVIQLDSTIERAADPMDNVHKKVDGIILDFNPETAKEDFWENLYQLSSAIVAEQTHDKFKFEKPLYLVNPDGAFDDFVALIYDLHILGVIPQDPKSLINIVSSTDEAVEHMRTRDRFDYRRHHVPTYATRKKQYEIEGRPSPYDFNPLIILSATSENDKYLALARTLTKAFVEAKMGVYSGGGAYGPMGEVTDTAYAMRRSHSSFHGASNVPHIMSGEGDTRDLTNEFFLARNIYERMEYFIERCSSVNAIAGGMGTVQEIALGALMLKRALETGDKYAKHMMGGKHTVIVNTQISHDGKKRGIFDGLLKIIPEQDFEALNIHIVETADDAVSLNMSLRQNMRNPEAANTNIGSSTPWRLHG